MEVRESALWNLNRRDTAIPFISIQTKNNCCQRQGLMGKKTPKKKPPGLIMALQLLPSSNPFGHFSCHESPISSPPGCLPLPSRPTGPCSISLKLRPSFVMMLKRGLNMVLFPKCVDIISSKNIYLFIHSFTYLLFLLIYEFTCGFIYLFIYVFIQTR